MQEEEEQKQEVQESIARPFYVYLLESADKKCTYIGATVDLNHRLRQHNGEITGGAKATSRKIGNGQKWTRVGYVTGFIDWKSALQFEWRWKQLTRQQMKQKTTMERRLGALQALLQLERPTSKAIKYSDWPAPPRVVFEDERWKRDLP
jgi:structure-specific endonuclease subunit SLX1